MLLAIIPARGGSKGIPRKNLSLLNGRKLIEYSIEAAQRSQYIDDILLSTDDDEIASVGQQLGLDVSYRRPSVLAGDSSSMIDTLEHGICWIEKYKGEMPDEIILLQPTSPLRNVHDIDKAVVLFRDSMAPSLVSVHAMREHPCECIVDNFTTWDYLVTPSENVVRRQDYRHNYFYINGAIYIIKTNYLLSQRKFVTPQDTVVYEMPPERGIDIDNPIDLHIAAAIMNTIASL